MTYAPAPRHEVTCPRCGRTGLVSYFANAVPTHKRLAGTGYCIPVDGVTLATIQAVGAEEYERQILHGRGGQA